MYRRLSEQDHYQVLEVDYSATPEEIQAAFESAREVYGKESLVSNSILTAEERRQALTRITEAYNTLIAEESRRLYDESLFGDTIRSSQTSEGVEQAGPEHDLAPSLDRESGYPKLVKGAQSADEPLKRARVQLGFKEEASGDFLRRARESAGLDLRAIAEETKIGVTMLGYIEEERVERLPAAVYTKNFVAQYAQCLGLEPEKVARSYLARIRRQQSKDT